MADSINIGNITVNKFYLGNSDDVQIYLGTVKLYPQDTPVTTSYLTFVANGNTKFKLSGNSVSYSLDSGSTWTSLSSNAYSPVVSSGSTIMWKTTNPTINGDNGIGRFYTSGGTFDVEGNVMSLLYGDNYEGQTALQGDNQFRGLFDSNSSVVNASGMTLPATAMTANCYRSMFGNCSHLESAPTELPATTLADSCYRYMFARTRVANAPSTLPATTLTDYCYYQMFQGTRITTAPSLPATVMTDSCYFQMFYLCTSLTTAPQLPATTLSRSCYNSMFYNCTSLTYVKCLATTNLTSSNTYHMFNGITTTGTFERASGAIWPCEAMIPSTWTITPAYAPVYAWNTSTDETDYVCDTTTYTKYYKDYYQVSYQNGCNYQNVTPVQWRQSSSVIEYNSKDCGFVAGYFTIRSRANNNTITLKNNTTGTSVGTTSFAYSLDSGSTWASFTLATGSTKTIATLSSGATVMLKGTKNRLGVAYNYGHYFRGSADYEIEGNIASLVNGDNSTTDLSSKSAHTFSQLFSGDTHLVSAENLKIYSTELPANCFNSTFRGCTSLQKAPELPSTVLGAETYSSMFEGCIALSQPPSQLVFTSADSTSYQRMFCMSRSSKITTPAMTYSPKLFGDWGSSSPVQQQMFCGNGNLTDIYCYWTNTSGRFANMLNWVNYTADSGVTFNKRSAQSFVKGVSGIKAGWTVVNDNTTQPT